MIFLGVVDPPKNIVPNSSCQENVQRLEIEWDEPSTLIGVDIINYTILFEDLKYSTSGSTNNFDTDFPYLNSSTCQNQTTCAAASTLAGRSTFTCTEALLIESKFEMKATSIHSIYICTGLNSNNRNG